MPIRYLVDSVEASISFYVELLGFEVQENWGGLFAVVRRGDTVLWLAGPETTGWRPMPDSRQPEPGGWNRIVVEVEDLDTLVARLRTVNVIFRNEPFAAPGGRQVLIEDLSGNPVELFCHNPPSGLPGMS